MMHRPEHQWQTFLDDPEVTLRPNAEGQYHMWSEVPNAGTIWSTSFEEGDLTSLTSSSGAPSIVTDQVHHGTYALYMPVTYQYVTKTVTGQTLIYFNFKFRTPSSFSGGSLARLYDGSNSIAARLSFTSTKIQLDRYKPDYASLIANQIFSANTWYTVEIAIQVDATVGFHKVWVNGTLKIDEENVDTSGYGTITGVWLIVSNADGIWFDCITVSSGPIGIENRPALVNDQSDNTGIQVVAYAGQTVGVTTLKTMYNLADTALAGTINSVTAYARAKVGAGAGAVETLRILWRTYATDYESGDITVSRVAFTDYSEARATNPNTGAAWTWAEVNALQIGARASALAATESITVTEFWIEVTYSVVALAPLKWTPHAALVTRLNQQMKKPWSQRFGHLKPLKLKY